MLNKNGLKAVGSFARNILEMASPFIAIGLMTSKPSGNKRIVTYSDAVNAILHSSMFSDDKTEAISALKMDLNPEIYEAVIGVVRSSMFSGNKIKLIYKLCNQVEEA